MIQAIGGSTGRIGGLLIREAYVMRRSPARAVELLLMPVVEVMIWSLLSALILSEGVPGVAQSVLFAVILWQTLYRSQQAVLTGFMEDVWSRSIATTLSTPLTIGEYVVGIVTASVAKASISILVMVGVIPFVSSLSIQLDFATGLAYVLILLPFGWALGILGMSLVLRFGHGGEVLALTLPVIVQPLACVFYPASFLPPFLEEIARCLPITWVFEHMRSGEQGLAVLVWPAVGSWALVAASAFVLGLTLRTARRSGRLARFAE